MRIALAKIKGFVVGGILLVMAGCVSTDRIGSAEEHSRGHFVWPMQKPCSQFLVTWQPTDDDIVKLEPRLAKSLRSKGPYSLGDYVIRYYGTEEKGRRFIICSGEHYKTGTADRLLQLPSDDMVELTAWGGGNYYFKASYDVGSDKIVTLGFNAPL